MSTNATQRLCNVCHTMFKTSGDWATCFKCNAKQKTTRCTDCHTMFNGKGQYTRCFSCSSAAKRDECEGCHTKFDGKGKYVLCFNCNKVAAMGLNAAYDADPDVVMAALSMGTIHVDDIPGHN